jgi:hypothetical protein
MRRQVMRHQTLVLINENCQVLFIDLGIAALGRSPLKALLEQNWLEFAASGLVFFVGVMHNYYDCRCGGQDSLSPNKASGNLGNA